MLAFARATALTLLFAACSLRSTSELTRCASKPDDPTCATAGAAGSSGSGGSTAGNGGAGGMAGSAAEAGAGGEVAVAGAGGAAGGASCSEDVDCDPNEICGAMGSCEPGLVVFYADNQKEGDPEDPAASTYIRPLLVIENLLNESVLREELKLRYYYTVEDTAPEDWDCFFYDGSTSCPGLEVSFVGPVTEHYVELTFTNGELPFGGDSGEIRIGIFKDDFSKYNQNDDYSYKTCDIVPPVDSCNAITLYRNDQLVWGVEPTY